MVETEQAASAAAESDEMEAAAVGAALVAAQVAVGHPELGASSFQIRLSFGFSVIYTGDNSFSPAGVLLVGIESRSFQEHS